MGKHCCCCCCCCCFDDALFALIKELSHNERKTNHRAVIPASRAEREGEAQRQRGGGVDGRVGVNRSMTLRLKDEILLDVKVEGNNN